MSSVGVGVTGYLGYSHFTGVQVTCFSGAGCEEVQAIRFAFVFGVPIVLFGLGFYLASFLLGLGGLLGGSGRARGTVPVLFVLTLTAGLFSLYLTGLQLFVLHTLCVWCMASAGLAMCLLMLSVALLWRW